MPAPHSPFDPLARLEPGEDRFVVREHDPVGPEAITAWCHLRRMWAFKTYGTDPIEGSEARRRLDAELAQCAEAEEKALTWRERQSGGAAVEGAKAAYAEVRLTEEQIAAAKRQKNVAELIRNLREAAYHACEVIERDGPAADAAMVEAHETLNEIANRLEYGPGEARAA